MSKTEITDKPDSILDEFDDMPGLEDELDDISIVRDENTAETAKPELHSDEGDELWIKFIETLSEKKESTLPIENKKLCRIEADIADTLDDINIDKASRTELVNAILKAFILTNLDRLASFRKVRRTLLPQPENKTI